MRTDSASQPWRKTLCNLLVPTYLLLIFGVPPAVIVGLWSLSEDRWLHIVVAAIGFPLFSTLLSIAAGALSLAHQKAIIPGKFPRTSEHPIYFHRRLYGLCWTSLYYFKPSYYLCLTVPALKAMTFRLFGYRGQLDFIVYPDTWIRDLPLLDFGKGAYIANRSTLGTNMAMSNGTTLVGWIKIGENSVVGHLAAIAPGCTLGDNVEIGTMTGIGYKCSFGDGTSIQPRCAIEHGTRTGVNCQIGASTYTGISVQIGDNVTVPSGSVIQARSRIRSNSDVTTLSTTS